MDCTFKVSLKGGIEDFLTKRGHRISHMMDIIDKTVATICVLIIIYILFRVITFAMLANTAVVIRKLIVHVIALDCQKVQKMWFT